MGLQILVNCQSDALTIKPLALWHWSRGYDATDVIQVIVYFKEQL